MPSLTEPVVPSGRMRALEQPTLPADGLTVRPWRPEDAPALLTAYQDPAIQRWHVRSMSALAEASAWIASRRAHWNQETAADWAVVDSGTVTGNGAVAEDGSVVGRVGIGHFDLHEGVADIAYWVLPHARGRNTAARAVEAVGRWSFDVLGLYRMELGHSTANDASCRVAVKSGFLLEGTRRRHGRHTDGRHDMHLHARLATDRR